MTTPQQTTVQCVQCGMPVPIVVRNIIDVQTDPQSKNLLLNEQLNMAICQSCGAPNKVATPLLYHDGSKELLIALVPMEMGGMAQDQEKVIGDMMNRLTAAIPKENFKAYMFSPKRAITLQGLLDQVLEADGITPEMLNEQKARIELLQKLISAATQEEMEVLVQQHSADINMQFFQTLSVTAQRVAQEGRQDILNRLAILQDTLLRLTDIGKQLAQAQEKQQQVVQQVAERIQTLGENATRADFIQLVIDFQADDDKLEALVGLIRPAFDYEFFQAFTAEIGKAPADERASLEELRDKLSELTQEIDAQMQQTVQRASMILQQMVNAPDLHEFVENNSELFDEDFMTVLSANLQEAERRGDEEMYQRLVHIYQHVVEILQSRMEPELRFINDLLSQDNPEAIKKIITDNTDAFDSSIIEWVDNVEQILTQQGRVDILERLQIVRSELATHFN